MTYQIYRNSTLGNALQETINELIKYGQITPAIGMKILQQFDKSMNYSLANNVKTKIYFKAELLNTYKFCDNIWTFVLNDIKFNESSGITKVDKLKIVACGKINT